MAMTTFKTRGLVLREYEAGESDKRIVLLCKGHGRITAYARGARKVKSKFLAATQLFTYGDYVIADGRQFFSMSQAQIIESFYPIRQDYDKLCFAQYILEICEKTVPGGSASAGSGSYGGCDELLRLALKTLQHISGDSIQGLQAVQVFLFRFFLFSGLAPEMDLCSICNCVLDNSVMFCDEGMVCSSCQSQGTLASSNKISLPLSAAAKEAIRHILLSDLNNAFMFSVQDSVLKELASASQLCWRGHFSFDLRTEI